MWIALQQGGIPVYTFIYSYGVHMCIVNPINVNWHNKQIVIVLKVSQFVVGTINMSVGIM